MTAEEEDTVVDGAGVHDVSQEDYSTVENVEVVAVLVDHFLILLRVNSTEKNLALMEKRLDMKCIGV